MYDASSPSILAPRRTRTDYHGAGTAGTVGTYGTPCTYCVLFIFAVRRGGASMLGDDASYIAQVLIGIALRPTFLPNTRSRVLGPSLT